MTTFCSTLTTTGFFFFDEPMESETPFIISVNSCGEEALLTSGIPLDDVDASAPRGVVEPGTNDSSKGAGMAVMSSHFSRILSEYSAPFHLNATTAPKNTALPNKKLETADPDVDSVDTAATIVVVAVSRISVSKGLLKWSRVDTGTLGGALAIGKGEKDATLDDSKNRYTMNNVQFREGAIIAVDLTLYNGERCYNLIIVKLERHNVPSCSWSTYLLGFKSDLTHLSKSRVLEYLLNIFFIRVISRLIVTMNPSDVRRWKRCYYSFGKALLTIDNKEPTVFELFYLTELEGKTVNDGTAQSSEHQHEPSLVGNAAFAGRIFGSCGLCATVPLEPMYSSS